MGPARKCCNVTSASCRNPPVLGSCQPASLPTQGYQILKNSWNRAFYRNSLLFLFLLFQSRVNILWVVRIISPQWAILEGMSLKSPLFFLLLQTLGFPRGCWYFPLDSQWPRLGCRSAGPYFADRRKDIQTGGSHFRRVQLMCNHTRACRCWPRSAPQTGRACACSANASGGGSGTEPLWKMVATCKVQRVY